MRAYKITSDMGVCLGTYAGETMMEALDAMAREAGYIDQEDAVARGIAPFEGRMEEIESEFACAGCRSDLAGREYLWREGGDGPDAFCAECAARIDAEGPPEPYQEDDE